MFVKTLKHLRLDDRSTLKDSCLGDGLDGALRETGGTLFCYSNNCSVQLPLESLVTVLYFVERGIHLDRISW